MNKEPRVVKKLSIKTVIGIDREGDTKAYMIEKAKSQPDIVAFSGEVVGYRQQATQYGKSFALVGTFVGLNLETGEYFEGAQLFLPKDAADNLVAQFDGRKENDAYVAFSCIIKVVPDKAQGFMYITRPVQDATAITRKGELIKALAAIPLTKQIANGSKKAA